MSESSPPISSSKSSISCSSSNIISAKSSCLLTTSSSSSLSLRDSTIKDPERFQSIGLLVWSNRFSDLSTSTLKLVDNYLVKYDPIKPLILDNEPILPADFCDFIFPILIGYPNELPIDIKWIKNNINQMMNPGCYLVCTRSQLSNSTWSSSTSSIETLNTTTTSSRIKIGVYHTNLIANLTRLDANLLFVMQSAFKNDINLNVTYLVDFIDDLDSVRDHFFPHRLSQNMVQVMARSPYASKIRLRTHLQKLVDKLSRQPSEESIEQIKSSEDNNNDSKSNKNTIRRYLKRHDDLVQIYVDKLLPELYKVKETFVTEKPEDDRNFYSERFNFFLSKDCFTIILDQNCVYDRLQKKIMRELENDTKSGPFVRLIRSGAYVAIEGTPRYCNLKNPNQTFYSRSIFLCRLTSFPMIILQEGIKCFDAYYNNDGLDFTYFDSIPINDLLYIDWYQIQIDFKMDDKPRIFKGHIMFYNEMNDILPTLPFTQMKFDPDMAAKIQLLCMEDEESSGRQPYRPLIIFTLQQVLYTYYDPLRSRLEILWNLYFRIDDSHCERLSNKNKINNIGNELYFYMKSFNCNYSWTQLNADTILKEESNCDITISSVDITDIDLAKVGWSHQMFEQYLNLYLGRLYPYQNSIKQWLLNETRHLKRQLIVRATTLTDKLLYRNGFYQTKLEQFHKEQAQKPRKSILNMPEIIKIRSKAIKNNDNNSEKSTNKTSSSCLSPNNRKLQSLMMILMKQSKQTIKNSNQLMKTKSKTNINNDNEDNNDNNNNDNKNNK